MDEYLPIFLRQDDTAANAKPLSIIPLKNSTIVPYFKESNAQYKSTAYSVVGVHGICIKHAGRAEARMLAFNRFELEEWIEALRSAAGTPSPLYKRGWGIDALMTSVNINDVSTLWEVQGPVTCQHKSWRANNRCNSYPRRNFFTGLMQAALWSL